MYNESARFYYARRTHFRQQCRSRYGTQPNYLVAPPLSNSHGERPAVWHCNRLISGPRDRCAGWVRFPHLPLALTSFPLSGFRQTIPNPIRRCKARSFGCANNFRPSFVANAEVSLWRLAGCRSTRPTAYRTWLFHSASRIGNSTEIVSLDPQSRSIEATRPVIAPKRSPVSKVWRHKGHAPAVNFAGASPIRDSTIPPHFSHLMRTMVSSLRCTRKICSPTV